MADAVAVPAFGLSLRSLPFAALWVVAKSSSHRFETMVETVVAWYFLDRNQFQHFLGGAKWISSIRGMWLCSAVDFKGETTAGHIPPTPNARCSIC